MSTPQEIGRERPPLEYRAIGMDVVQLNAAFADGFGVSHTIGGGSEGTIVILVREKKS